MLMPKATADDPAPLLIVALRSQQEVDELAQGRGGKLRHAGIFLPGSDQTFILLDISDGPWRTVYHEYAHELLHARSEEHTSELQSQSNLVCRLLLEKKKKQNLQHHTHTH